MDYNAFLERILFSIGEKEFTVIHVVFSFLSLAGIAIFYRITFSNILPLYFRSDTLHADNHEKVKKRIRIFFLFAGSDCFGLGFGSGLYYLRK